MRYLLVTASAVMVALAGFLAARHYGRTVGAGVQPTVGVGSKEPAADQAGTLGSAAGREELLRRLETLARTVKERPADAAAHLELGSIQLRLGRTGEARASFQRASQLEPTSTGALYGLAACSEAEGDYREALKTYLEIQKLRPDDPGLDQRIRSVQSALAGASKQP